MKRWSVFWLGLCLVAAMLISVPLQAAEPGVKGWTAGQAIASPAPSPATVTVQASAVVAEKRLGLLERRKLGLTIGELRPLIKQMLKDGRIDPSNPSAAAVAVMDELSRQNPTAWQDKTAAPDWDAVLEFLEKLIPLIVQLISLFGA